MKRYKCVVSYVGANYTGWQCQKHGASIQEEIEKVIYHITQVPTRIVAAGRTDAKVNAQGQVFHFDTEREMSAYKWKGALNGYLPKDIRIMDVQEVDHLFHARFCVKCKRYDYKINLGPYNVFEKDYVYQCPYPLDIEAMKEASKYFIGTHDFTSFSGNSLEEMPDQVRTVFSIDFKLEHDVLTISYYGQGFLRYMVRMMSAQLMEVGRHLVEPEKVKYFLDAKSKTLSRKNANAEGLTLVEIDYFELIAETDDILLREPLFYDELPFDWTYEDLEQRILTKAYPRVYCYTTRDGKTLLGYVVLWKDKTYHFDFYLLDVEEGKNYFKFEKQLQDYILKQDEHGIVEIQFMDLKNVKNPL